MDKNTETGQLERLVVEDPATIKVILHPLRTRILTGLSQGPRTVRELSDFLETEQTKLYYHIRLLLRAGLVVAAGERQVGNLTETSYACAAKEIVVDPALAMNSGPGSSGEGAVRAFLAALRASLLASMRRLEGLKGAWKDEGKVSVHGPRSLTMAIESVRLLPGEAEELARRVKELLAEFEARNGPKPEADSYEIGYAIYLAAAPTSMEKDGSHE